MLIGCCHCGDESESSQSASGSASASASASDGAGSASASSASESASSDSTPPYGDCANCNYGISPNVYEFTWAIQNNCPWDPDTGQPEVGCFDNFNFPVQLQRDSFTWNPYFGESLLVAGACLWRSTGVGGVSVDGAGQCSPWPSIQLAIGRETGGAQRYFALLYIEWFGPYDPADPFEPVTVTGILKYQKIFGESPPNCLATIELDFALAGGNFEEPPGGTGYGMAFGPGCNVAWGDGDLIGENTFPSTITIAPLL